MTKTAFVFPGQGSQSIGMLAELASNYPIILQTFNQSSNAVGYDVWELTQSGPLERLNQTEHTQVAMLTADVAVYRLLRELNVPQPDYMAGHSLGEYSALVAAGALSLEDAARLVARRGAVMQSAVPLGAGAMAAVVGLDDGVVRELCQKASTPTEQVTAANYNAIGQVVVAGHTQAVLRLITLAEAAEARLAKIIPVSVPCHCPLLFEASAVFATALQETPFNSPAIPVVSNVDVACYDSVDAIRLRLTEQLHQPVRWVETIQWLAAQGVTSIVECGPGKVLTGLIKRIDRTLEATCIQDESSLNALINR